MQGRHRRAYSIKRSEITGRNRNKNLVRNHDRLHRVTAVERGCLPAASSCRVRIYQY
ncbi:unnamed protein product [Ascophyllum nodosum]